MNRAILLDNIQTNKAKGEIKTLLDNTEAKPLRDKHIYSQDILS